MEPIWCREAIPNPRKLTTPTTPTTPSFPLFYLEHCEIDIKSLMKEYREVTGQSCSTVVASLWQCRTRAIGGFDPETDMQLCIGDGYYGNCISLLRLSATCLMVSQSPTVEINKAKFTEWAKGESEDVDFTYNTLMATDWTHLGRKGLDFGGRPVVRFVTVLANQLLHQLVGQEQRQFQGDDQVCN